MSIPKLTIKLLGRFEVLRDGEPIPDEAWGRRKTKALLKVLLTDPGHVFTHDQLIDALFGGESVDKAAENLYGRVSELRRALEPDLKRGADSAYILRKGPGYSFNKETCGEIDTVSFQRELAEAEMLVEKRDWAAAAECLDQAVNLYQGEYLPEERYEDWAEVARKDMRRKYIDAMIELSKCYEQLGRLRQAISCCQRILNLEPHREDIIREVMRYQSEAGQRDQALDTYREGERALRNYLDVEPSAETRALRDQIAMLKEQEPKLDPRRIAVLPLQNYSPDPEDEYIAAGMTEELIGCLSKVRDFRVIARTSVMRFKDTAKPISQVANALHVGTVLEGSVRKVGDRLRISAQLVDANTEEHLWASEFESSTAGILSAQCEFAQKVAGALATELLPAEVAQLCISGVDTPLTRKHCVKGRFFFEKGFPSEIQKGVRCFKQALDLDPNHAPAYAGLALCYTHLMESSLPMDEAHRLAKQAANRALELNAALAEAHTAMGLIRLVFELDPEGAERSLRKAAQLNPSYAPARLWQGFRALWMSQFEEAITEFRAALELDPLSPYSYFMLSRPLAALNRFSEAFDVLERSLEIDPAHLPSLGRVHVFRCWLWDWSGAEDAIEELDRRGFPGRVKLYRMFIALYRGDCEECLREAEGWLDFLVPYGPSEVLWGRTHLQAISLCVRDYEGSLEHMNQYLAACPSGNGPFDVCRLLFNGAVACEGLGRVQDALALLERASTFVHGEFQAEWGASVWVDAAIGMMHAAMGETGKAREILDRLNRSMPQRDTAAACAVLSFRLGLTDDGFKWLGRAIGNHDRFLLTIKTHPWFDAARDDPRFTGILERMNLAA